VTDWRAAALEHAQSELPREACGLVVVYKGREIYYKCRNLAVGNDQFVLSPDDYELADGMGEIVAVIHSHPNASPEPSQADLVSCEASGLEWHIVNVPVGHWHSFKPTGYQAPLVGRTFSHGVLDCYAIVQDWYSRERGIELQQFERHDGWWETGQNLYVDNYAQAGWKPCEELHEGAILLMQIGSPVPNHAAVFIGDNMILHHVQGRLSSRDVYGGYWRKVTTHILRYTGRTTA